MKPKPSLNPKSNHQGAVLIISLWILAILTLLAFSIGRRISIELRLLKYHLNRTQAFYLAKAGLEHIYAQKAGDSQDDYDSLNEAWSNKLKADQKTPYFQEFTWGNGEFEVKYDYPQGQVLYGMQDESSKLNINKILNGDGSVNNDRKKEFTNLLKNVLGDDSKAQEMTAKFIDWVDKDSDPISINGKENYSDKGISPKNAPLDRLEELTMIDGFSIEDVKKLSNYITIYGGEYININTTSQEALRALGLDESVINSIISYRNGEDNQAATEDDKTIENIDNELINDSKIFNSQLTLQESEDIKNIKSRLAVKSSFYKAKSSGTVNKIKKEITTVIQTNPNQHPQCLYWYEE